MQVTAGAEPCCERVNEFRLQKPAFVMAFLGPGVWKKYVNAGKARGPDHVFDNIDRIMLDDANVRQLTGFDEAQKAADAGRVDFHANVVILRMLGCYLRRGFAHTETDLQEFRGATAKDNVEVAGCRTVCNAELRQQGIDGTPLGV
jgi:hypothetical protein